MALEDAALLVEMLDRDLVSGGGARLIVSRTSNKPIAAPNSVIAQRPDGLYDILEPINDFFEMHANNHGQTPARLHHIRVGFCDASLPLPTVPPYEDPIPCRDDLGPATQSRFLRQIRLTGEMGSYCYLRALLLV